MDPKIQVRKLAQMYLTQEGIDFGKKKTINILWPLICDHIGVDPYETTTRRRDRPLILLAWFKTETCDRDALRQCISRRKVLRAEYQDQLCERNIRARSATRPSDFRPYPVCKLGKGFYATEEWRTLRYRALMKFGNRCMCCGRAPRDGIVLHVDHIKPKSIWPELALNIENLQILCADCNKAKSNCDAMNWRALFLREGCG